MVIIFSKTLEKKKGVNDVRSKNKERLLSELHTMSRGTTLFSCGTVEADRWLEMGRGCALQQGAPCPSRSSLESLWDLLPAQSGQAWAKEPGSSSSSAITSLIQDLNLGDATKPAPLCLSPASIAPPSQTPAAPPSKRQCRSLSFSDEFGGFRSCWRPQGSRVWTAVEKRRCHSGGSVRGGSSLPSMQRSSSFSLPSRCSLPLDGPLDLPLFTQRLPLHHQFTASPVSPTSPPAQHHHPEHSSSRHQHLLRPLSLSHEQISHTEEVSEASSPDSTPELGRRAPQRPPGRKGCLSRSRSQPCVIDQKVGMKRRRPEEQEQRPSLDLAKMTQNLQTFQSLSCPGFPSPPDSTFPHLHLPSFQSRPSESDFRTQPRLLEPRPEETEDPGDLSYEEDSDSACSVGSPSASPDPFALSLWKEERDKKKTRDLFQLGGELDLDQIERN